MKTWIARKYQDKCVRRGFKGSLALFLDPGLGKTSILLEILRLLIRYKKAKGALIVAPINPLYMTWPEEIKGWANFRHLKYKILHVSIELCKFRDCQIYLINPEKLTNFLPILLKTPKEDWPFDVLIIDESAKFKDTKSARTKLMLKLAPKFKYCYVANGTPTGNGYKGLYSQMKIVDGGKCLGRTKTDFMDKYFRLVGKPEWYQYDLRQGSEEQIIEDIAPKAIVLKAEDYVDLPEDIVSPVFIQLPDKVQKIYDEMKKELFTMLKGEEFVAETASTLANILHQICNGCLYNMQDPLALYVLPMKRGYNILHKEKINALKDLIEQYEGRQILIGYKFQNDRELLEQTFGKKMTFFNKAKTRKDKVAIQDSWNAGKIKLLAGEMSSMSLGLNLQKSSANVAIAYSLSGDFEVWDQWCRRLKRSGNTAKHIHFHPILCKGGYDHKVVWATLKKRGKSHTKFFSLMKEYVK